MWLDIIPWTVTYAAMSPSKGLVTYYREMGGGGGATKREGGHVQFYPYVKGGGGRF